MSFLGLQDAARKRRPPLQVPGPWNGAMVESVPNGVFVSLVQDKWDKMKAEIRELGNKLTDFQCDVYDSWLPYTDLRSKTRSMGYAACTYPAFIPFLKGFYLTLDSLHKDRDAKGWPMKKARCVKKEKGCVAQVEADYADDSDDDDHDDDWEVQWLLIEDDLASLPGAGAGMTHPLGDDNEYALLWVPAVPRLFDDVHALDYLTLTRNLLIEELAQPLQPPSTLHLVMPWGLALASACPSKEIQASTMT
jgi:hypothetical protein